MNGGWHVGSAECMDIEETVQVQVPWLLTEGARLPFTSAGGVPLFTVTVETGHRPKSARYATSTQLQLCTQPLPDIYL